MTHPRFVPTPASTGPAPAAARAQGQAAAAADDRATVATENTRELQRYVSEGELSLLLTDACRITAADVLMQPGEDALLSKRLSWAHRVAENADGVAQELLGVVLGHPAVRTALQPGGSLDAATLAAAVRELLDGWVRDR